MVLIGYAKKKTETQEFGSNGFRKRELVITTEEQYPQYILIEFVQDKCELLNSIHSGDKLKVSINIRGREWVNPQGETKYFNSIQGWKIEMLEKAGEQTKQTQGNGGSANTPEPTNSQNNNQEKEEDDLPF